MSDKKKSEQTPADKKSSAATSNVDNQTDLSASINMTSSYTEPSPKKAKGDEPLDKITQAEALIDKNPNKSTENVKNSASITSKSANDNKPLASNSANNKISKLAVLALIIALLAIGASAGHYYWSEQQKGLFSQHLSDKIQKQLQQSQGQVAQQLTQKLAQQQQAHNTQLNRLKTSIERNTENSIMELQKQQQQQMASLRQNQPSDWLLQEAEYLIRVAARSLWLEKNTSTAINLLTDADQRIQELNDPQFLELRQIIQQDIAQLQLLPTLNIDEIILKLMALDQQIKQLPLFAIKKFDSDAANTSNELTGEISDWRENLAKTWHKITEKFLTVSRKTSNEKPLISPQFQQNLRENLSLKIQTAIWAASKAKQSIYRESLTDVNNWLNDYFDMSATANKNFSQNISLLQQQVISADYPNKFNSLSKIRAIISSQSDKASPLTPKKDSENVDNEQTEKTEKNDASKQEGAL